MSIIIRVLPYHNPCSSPPSAQLQLSPSSSPSLQTSISPKNGDLDLDTYLQSFNASEMLVDDRRFFIYNFRTDAAEDEASED
jgi:hypothetical protein